MSNPSLRFLYFRNPCCGKETKNLTQFFQVPYLCQQNKKLNVIIKRGGKGKSRRWNSSFGLDYQWETVSKHLHSMSQNVNCVWSVLGGGVISARLRQEKEIAAALWHTKSVNAVNIIAKKCFFRTPTPVCRHQVWSDHLIETPASFWGWKFYLRDTRTS